MNKSLIILCLTLLLILSCSTRTKDKYLGIWVVNQEKTAEYFQTTPQWHDLSSEEQAMFPEVLREISLDMEISFTEKQVETYISGLKTAFPYKTTTKSDSLYVLLVDAEGQKVRLSISFPYEKLMNLKSEINADLDYYIWEKKY